MKRIFSIGLFAFAIFAGDPLFAQQALKPRAVIAKPARTIVDRQKHDAERIYVKFRDDAPVRLRTGKLAGLGAAGWLQRLENRGAKWERQHAVSEEKLSEMRDKAQRATGKAMPDLNTAFIVRVPRGVDAAALIDELNALDSVEFAEPMPLPAPEPVAGNYEPQQGYLDPAVGGIDVDFARNIPGGTGTDVCICDIESSWNTTHNDITATLLGGVPTLVATANIQHGTAVLGMLGGRNNGVGVTGIAFDSPLFFASRQTAAGFNPAGAITTATAALRAGDIMVLEMQADGPAAMVDAMGNATDFVPIEWIQACYDAIVTAVGNGIIVVEAAGNGNQNLDSAIFNTGHAPFRAENDSGAIIVGAGAVPGGSDTDRSRLGFSSYGSTVDLQGWGENVVTTGYGDLFMTDGANSFYTAVFNGTSSATPTVAGACAVLQGIHKASNGSAVISPRKMRDLLRATGSPQQAGMSPANQNIGPRPNLAAAIPFVRGAVTWVDFSFTANPPISLENGSFEQPWNTFAEGVAAVPAGGTVVIKAGSRFENLSNITKPLTVRNFNGPATIGQ